MTSEQTPGLSPYLAIPPPPPPPPPRCVQGNTLCAIVSVITIQSKYFNHPSLGNTTKYYSHKA